MSGLCLGLDPGPIERVQADIAVVTLFEDERPLRGGAARADWRLCGTLSRLLQREKLTGAFGEAALVPTTGGLRARWLLALGLGRREDFDELRSREFALACVTRGLDLNADEVALPLPPAGPEDPGPEARLDLLLDVLEDLSPDLDHEVRVRLLAAAEEQPALIELLQRHSRSRGRSALRIELPAPAPRPARLLSAEAALLEEPPPLPGAEVRVK